MQGIHGGKKRELGACTWWKEELVKEVMTPKTHVKVALKKYAVLALSYVARALG
jgi:hypothetical protein